MSGKGLSFAVLALSVFVADAAQAGCLFGGHCRRPHRCAGCGPAATQVYAAPLPNVGCGLFGGANFGPSCAAPMPDPCCGLMPGPACCPPPVECCPPPMQPIVETCLVPQQCTTFRDIPETCLRREPVCQTVPVTTMRQVTVDEGCYQQVWVPRLVTKNVPQTTLTQQLSYRDVPYQTMRRVPVTETRLIPQQRVRMVPGCPDPCGIPGGCGMPMPGPATLGPIVPEAGVPAGSSGIPSLPPASLPGSSYNPPSKPSASIPVPPGSDPSGAPKTGAAEDEWTTIERRAAFFEKEFGYRPAGSPVRPAAYRKPAEALWTN